MSGLEELALTDNLKFILGRPCFMFIGLASLWRKTGDHIETQAESEQAYFIHLMLNLYLKHGAGWGDEFKNMIDDRKATLQSTGGEG